VGKLSLAFGADRLFGRGPKFAAAAIVLMAASACRSGDRHAHNFPSRVDPAALHARYGDALYSQDAEETLIRAFFEDRRNGVFLDVGAGDPVKNSTTYYLENHLGWRGSPWMPWPNTRSTTRGCGRPRVSFPIRGDRSGLKRDFYASPDRISRPQRR